MNSFKSRGEVFGDAREPCCCSTSVSSKGAEHSEDRVRFVNIRSQGEAEELRADSVDEGTSSKPPQFAEEQRESEPREEKHQAEWLSHRAKTRSSVGRRSIRPAHRQHAAIMASALRTAS